MAHCGTGSGIAHGNESAAESESETATATVVSGHLVVLSALLLVALQSSRVR